MLHLIGQPAFSAFRIEKLLRGLRAELPEITGLRSEYHYFAEVDGGGQLSPADLNVLKTLLIADNTESVVKPDETLLLVTPRPGTISPWSTKATDIVHNSGLTQLQRVERGIAYHLPVVEKSKGCVPDEIKDLLHDRMTQSLVGSLDGARALFSHHQPASLNRIDILGHGRTDSPAEPARYNIEQVAADVTVIIRELFNERVHAEKI